MPRLHEVSSGTVEVGGVDVRRLRQEALIESLGVVSQETYLFHATVRENLRFARPTASDDEIEERIGTRAQTEPTMPKGVAVIPITGPIIPHGDMFSTCRSVMAARGSVSGDRSFGSHSKPSGWSSASPRGAGSPLLREAARRQRAVVRRLSAPLEP